MKIEVKQVTPWSRVLNAARFTVGKPLKSEIQDPSRDFKNAMLTAEHSPLRLLEFDIRCYDVPFFIISHITRHKIGVEFFVSTSRPDRNCNVKDRHEQRKDDPANIQISINAEALINISRKRLCFKAETPTRHFWEAVCTGVIRVVPEFAPFLVQDCEYKHRCTEIESCGWWRETGSKFY